MTKRRVSKANRTVSRAGRQRWRPSLPLIIGILLALTAAGLAGWLQLTYDQEHAVKLATVDGAMVEQEPLGQPQSQPPAQPPAQSPAEDPSGEQVATAAERRVADTPHAEAEAQLADKPVAPDTAAPAKTPADGSSLTAQTAAGPETLGTDGATVSLTIRPRIAIVLSGLGLSRAQTSVAIENLPAAVTLAFAPDGKALAEWAKDAKDAGHELLLELPMEPDFYPTNEPGRHALLTVLSRDENLKRLEWLLGRFDGYVGVINFMGARFTRSVEHLRPVLAELKARNLLFVDRRTAEDSKVGDVAIEIGLGYAVSDRAIDRPVGRAKIESHLHELEELARREGRALGVGYPLPLTMELVAQWARTLPAKNIDLVPLSQVAFQPKTG